MHEPALSMSISHFPAPCVHASKHFLSLASTAKTAVAACWALLELAPQQAQVGLLQRTSIDILTPCKSLADGLPDLRTHCSATQATFHVACLQEAVIAQPIAHAVPCACRWHGHVGAGACHLDRSAVAQHHLGPQEHEDLPALRGAAPA